MARQTPYVSVNLTVPARDAVQRAALDFSARLGRRLPMSDIVVAALDIARQHEDALLDKLTTNTAIEQEGQE